MNSQQDINTMYQWIDTLTYSKRTLKKFRRAYNRRVRNRTILLYVGFFIGLLLVHVITALKN